MKIKWMVLIVFVLALPVTQSAYAAAPTFGSASQSARAHQMAVPKGKALVYIYYGRTDGQVVSPTIWLNNGSVGQLVPGSFTVWQIKPGTLTVRVDGGKSSSVSLNTRAGQKYHFRLVVSSGNNGISTKLKPLSSASSQHFSYTQWLSNPKDVTRLASRQPVQTVTKPKTRKPFIESSDDEEPGSNYGSDSGDSNIGMMLKTGVFAIAEETQTILAVDRAFDSSASGVLQLEVYVDFGSGFTAGGQLGTFSTQFNNVGMTNTHDVDVQLYIVNVRQFFRHQYKFQPYLGAGLGLATTEVSGPDLSGSTSGIAYQLMLGAEYRFSGIGLFAEYNYLAAETEDNNSEKIDVSGSGILAGLAFHF